MIPLAREAILEVENAELRRRVAELEGQVTTDPLTGLLNRRGLDAAWKRITRRVSRGSLKALSIILFDIDRFKESNDTYGHAHGDDVLRAIGALLRKIARSTDAVARVGGDEFIVLIEGPLEHACDTAERLRQDVNLADDDILRYITISCGVSEHRGVSSIRSVSIDPVLFQKADTALYEAKARGRNTVCCAA
jgi:diguanylate cyclase (GGDEF)-like protein